MKYALNFV